MLRLDFLLDASCFVGGLLSLLPAGPEDGPGCAIAVGCPAARRRGLVTGGEDSGGATFCLFARLGGDAFAVVGVSSRRGSGRAAAFRFRDLGGG